jgi:hypothetical protein
MRDADAVWVACATARVHDAGEGLGCSFLFPSTCSSLTESGWV